MSHLLRWASAKRADREALKAFTCTEPGHKARSAMGRWEDNHPRPWERLVQARIHIMKPPYPPPEFLLLGWDSDGIGAAVFYEELDGPAQVEVYVGAVANRYRRRGGGWADEMVTTLLDAITERAIEAGVDLVEVSAWVHDSNRPSQEMCRRCGMRHVGIREDEQLQRWSMLLLVSGAELRDI